LQFQEEAIKLRDQKKEVELLQGYSNNEIDEFKKQIDMSYDRQLSRITEMVILFINSYGLTGEFHWLVNG